MSRAPKRRSRRSRRPVATFVRRFWLLAVLLLAGAAYGAYRVIELPAFHYSSIAVEGGSRVSAHEVVAAAAIDPSANVWLLDRGAIERRIEAIPFVSTASLAVRPPAAVTIAIAERAIDGCVRDETGTALTVDARDRILVGGCDPAATVTYDVRSPLAGETGRTLHDAALAQLQRDRATLDPRAERYRSYAFDAFGELEATLRDGVVVAFGADGDLDAKDRLVAPILAQVAVRGRPVREVDLRAEHTPVVLFQARKPARPQPLHRF